jgi:kynurenine formamidase
VAETADAQEVELRPGDILMIRTGWVHYHLRERDAEQRKHDIRALRSTGLEPSHATVAWLWDNRFSVVGMDNVAVEVWPSRPESPFLTGAERRGDEPRTSYSGLMHRVLIPLLGMALGELWALDALAGRCAADGRWDCMIVAKPLNLTGGAGSPLNAVAIR